MLKTPLNVPQQLAQFQSHGILVQDEAAALSILERVSYTICPATHWSSAPAPTPTGIRLGPRLNRSMTDTASTKTCATFCASIWK